MTREQGRRLGLSLLALGGTLYALLAPGQTLVFATALCGALWLMARWGLL